MTHGKEIVLLPRSTEKEQDSVISGKAEVKLQKAEVFIHVQFSESNMFASDGNL